MLKNILDTNATNNINFKTVFFIIVILLIIIFLITYLSYIGRKNIFKFFKMLKIKKISYILKRKEKINYTKLLRSRKYVFEDSYIIAIKINQLLYSDHFLPIKIIKIKNINKNIKNEVTKLINESTCKLIFEKFELDINNIDIVILEKVKNEKRINFKLKKWLLLLSSKWCLNNKKILKELNKE